MGNIQFNILSGDLSVNMGSILENVFAQELISNGFLLRYFNKKNIGEIDFIVQKVSQPYRLKLSRAMTTQNTRHWIT